MNRCLHDLRRIKNPGKDYALVGLADNEKILACTKCKEWFIYTYRMSGNWWQDDFMDKQPEGINV